ncbi:MAG: phage/plasmid primase, P4 family [Ilumatobacteraceae bacterium]
MDDAEVGSYDPFTYGPVPQEIEWALAQGYALIPVRINELGKKVPQVKAWNKKRVPDETIRLHARLGNPAELFAVATGEMSGGLLVLDADTDVGLATLAELGLQPTLTTPGGGAHVWVSAPGLRVPSRGYSDEFPMLEVKANNGKATLYGVNPLKGGRRYTFTPWPPTVVPYADLPDHLRTYIESTPTNGGRSWEGSEPAVADDEWIASKLAQAIAKVHAGEGRNTTGHWFMERLWHQGCDELTMHRWGQQYQADVGELGNEPYSRQEIQDTVRSVLQRDPAGREPEARSGKRPNHVFPLNDTGMAQRLVAAHGDHIRYCAPRKTWYVWNGRYWQKDDTLALERFAKETAVSLYGEAERARDDEVRKLIVKAANAYQSTMKIKLVIENARSEPGVAVVPKDMDPDPFLLCVENGTLNLQTGLLGPHEPDHLITRMAPVEFIPDARDERWSSFLRHATGGDAEMAKFLQRLAFASLVGRVQDKVFAYVFGPGNTGKTTFLELLLATWGRGYSGSVDGEAFLKRSFTGGIRSDVARMDGRRLVVSNEMGEGQINEPLLKKLTGGDTITFEEKYVNPWEAEASFTIWMAGNEVPKALAESEALWHRWRQVPFVQVIPKADPKWLDRAKTDPQVRAAVLAWAVRGRVGWLRHGVGNAPIIEKATNELRQSMDPLRDFWEEACVFEPDAWTPSNDLLSAYTFWCGLRDQHQINPRDFSKLLRNKGCVDKVRSIAGKKVRGWQHVGLRKSQS